MALDSRRTTSDGTWSRVENASGGMLRIALLFGSVAVALSMIIAPMLESGTRAMTADSGAFDIDDTATGTIGYAGTYTIRRSVLQSDPNATCVIRSNGTRSGDC